MKVDAIPRVTEGNVYVLVEIPKGAYNKYDLDEELAVCAWTASSTRPSTSCTEVIEPQVPR
jgi:hypothetical protein